MATTRDAKTADFVPDAHNANLGTERGRYALETSLREYGAGRSILVDKNGKVIAGNKTLEVGAEIGIDDVIVVQTDGRQIVAVQRMDLDLAQDEKARMLAYADNRVGELDLSFDASAILADLQSGLNLETFWFESELDDILFAAENTSLADATESSDRNLGDKSKQIKAILYTDEIGDFERAIKATGNRNRGAALMEICRAYLENHAEGQFDFSVENLFAA